MDPVNVLQSEISFFISLLKINQLHVLMCFYSEKPQEPTITGVIPGHNSLTITWLRNYNGGAEQQFILAYREITDEKWRTSVPIHDTFDTCCVYILKYLNDDTNYEIRLYSNNSLGRSNFTRVWEVKTLCKSFNAIVKFVYIDI